MPIQPHPDRADWRVLLDANGAEMGAFLYAERDERRVADLFEPAPQMPLERVVAAILSELAGWRIAGDERLGGALVEAGGRPGRHAHVLTHDLAVVPQAHAGDLVALDHPAAELVPALLAAYGPAHPDFPAVQDEDPREQLERMLRGETLGPLLECSGVALDGERVVGAIIVTDAPGEPPFGGPWVSVLFRDPAHPGTGRALLARALVRARAAGLPALSLVVTVGNPALGLYESLGFRQVLTALSVDL